MELIWLSHILEESTPLYAGAKEIVIKTDRSIAAGESCNTSMISITSHSGTHVDAPFHFIAQGRCVAEYSPKEWIFNSPRLWHVSVKPGQMITPDIFLVPTKPEKDVDLLLIRTDFEMYRGDELYWRNGPGLSPDLAATLTQKYPNLCAVGLDCISISSLTNREKGREAHRAFLGAGLRIFEDMTLQKIYTGKNLIRVMAFPLRFANSDGSPCTIIGWIDVSS